MAFKHKKHLCNDINENHKILKTRIAQKLFYHVVNMTSFRPQKAFVFINLCY